MVIVMRLRTSYLESEALILNYEQLELVDKPKSSKKDKPISSLDKRIVRLLHKGKANAITAQEIGDIVGCDKDTVWKIIGKLRTKGGIPIGASKRVPLGYYIINDEIELRETLAMLDSDIKQKQETRQAIVKAFYATEKEQDCLA